MLKWAVRPWVWLLSVIPLSILAVHLIGVTWPAGLYVSPPVHAALEALVGAAALGLGALLLLLSDSRPNDHWLRWVSYALCVMGGMDLVHAVVQEPVLFVASRTLATFAGGVLIACLWLPRRPPVLLPWVVFALMLGLSLLWKYTPASMPPVLIDGEFTALARILNATGGLGFAAAMFWFIRSDETEKRIGAALCALLAASGLAFPVSELWDAEWWGWHLLRFAGGAAAAAYFGLVHINLVRQTREALQARETFLDMAAHELRTPLVPLLMRAQIMERELQKGTPVRLDEMKKLRRNVQFIVELTKGLFAATPHGVAARKLKNEPILVEALVGEVVETFQNISEIHPLRFTPTPELWVKGDALYLRQVIVNLVRNAMKYSPGGGPIDVSTERSDDTVQVAVRDRGVGIALEDQARIFDKFYRAGNFEQHAIAGLGLGLYISNDIVRAHGGRISVSSSPGEGATFTVTLPAIAAPSKEPVA